jgi:hypothetical protein
MDSFDSNFGQKALPLDKSKPKNSSHHHLNVAPPSPLGSSIIGTTSSIIGTTSVT